VGTVLTAVSHQSEGMVIAFTVIVGIGTGFTYASVPNLILNFVRQSSQATVGALTNVLQAVTPAVLSVITFTVLNSHIAMNIQGKAIYSNAGITRGFLIAVAVAVLGFVLTLALPRKTEE